MQSQKDLMCLLLTYVCCLQILFSLMRHFVAFVITCRWNLSATRVL
jgi:hypothetical protein